MESELVQKVKYKKIGKYNVSSDIFLDLIFNNECNCMCPFCIARTPSYSVENYEKWKESLKKTFEIFDIRNIVILGGEATIDPLFFQKLDYLKEVIKDKKIDNVILTTNGIVLKVNKMLDKVINSCITTINMSIMNSDKDKNDKLMQGKTLTHEEIYKIYNKLKNNNMTMRINTNVYKGNNDTLEEMMSFVNTFNGYADAIKFSPLMKTNMFCVVPEVTSYTNKVSLSKTAIKKLFNSFAKESNKISHNKKVFGLIQYGEVIFNNQKVILKYEQVEDTYDLNTTIPTLKLYNNGNLSNEWNYNKNILNDIES